MAGLTKHILNFDDCCLHPESFLSVQKKTADNVKSLTKSLYDFAASKTHEDVTSPALLELITENFDDEQIFQEIELQSDPTISKLLSQVSKLASLASLTFDVEEKEIDKAKKKRRKKKVQFEGDASSDSEQNENTHSNSELMSDNQHTSDDGDDDDDDDDDNELKTDDISKLLKQTQSGNDYNSDESEEEQYLKDLLDKATAERESGEDNTESDEDNADDLDFDFEAESSSKTKSHDSKHSKNNGLDIFGEELNSRNVTTKEKKRTTEVDDKFFKLADMEEFLDIEDLKEEKRIAKERGEIRNKESDTESEEDVDYFGDMPTDDENADAGWKVKYNGFFDPPDGDESMPADDSDTDASDDDDENLGENEEVQQMEVDSGLDSYDDNENTRTKPKSSSDLLGGSDSEGEDVAQILGGDKSSSYQKRRERLNTKIGHLEDAALAEKPWQLMGETQASSRGVNTLLEEDLDYEQQTKSAPAITEETTKTLEDIIKQRIKDQAFDDVERKVKPKEDAFEYKKRITLDQEKSKLSLGQVYEQEYLQQAEDKDEETVDPERADIKKMMTSLFVKLDALSNFHYTPKPAIPDVEIINNLPAINVEEVQPVNFSESQTLAPEEIQDKPKKELKGDTEKSKTDKLRERREKKKNQREKQKSREKREAIIAKLNPGLGNKYAKERAMEDLTKQSKRGRGVTLVEDEPGAKKMKKTTSTKFFKQLQEEVTTQVRSKKAENTKNKRKAGVSTAKLKL